MSDGKAKMTDQIFIPSVIMTDGEFRTSSINVLPYDITKEMNINREII